VPSVNGLLNVAATVVPLFEPMLAEVAAEQRSFPGGGGETVPLAVTDVDPPPPLIEIVSDE